MIQLATDPEASRSNWRPQVGDSKGEQAHPTRKRSGHAWPFISRQAERPVPQERKHAPGCDTGS